MKKIHLTVLIVLFALFFAHLSSCNSQRITPEEILNSPFRAELVIRSGELTSRATLHADAYGGNSPRDAVIRFSSPESLSSLAVERKNGSVTARLTSVSCTLEDCSAFLVCAELLTLRGDIEAAERCTLDGESADRIKCVNGIEIYFSRDGVPMFATDGKTSVKILEFESLDG